jgi:hypothetical protein
VLQRRNSVVFLGASIDACSLVRLFIPHWNLPGSSFFCFATKPDWNKISGMDVAVVQRCCTAPQFEFIRTAQALGIKVIYDLDDDVWDLPEYNPAHKMFMAYREGFNACIQGVDLVTVSTKYLRKKVKANVRNLRNCFTGREIPIVIAENRLDLKMMSTPEYNDHLTVGWQGSSSHVGDLHLVEEPIKRLCHEYYKTVNFEFRGCEPPPGLALFQNVFHKMWMPVAEYMRRMPKFGWHIALAPVTDHPFNDSKSSLKLMEAAYCKIPCLAAWVKPYAEFCEHDPELQWLLCAGPSAWYPKLRELINDEARRKFLGERMYAVLIDHYSFSKPHEGWRTAIDMVMED